jgi:hypothetical protein
LFGGISEDPLGGGVPALDDSVQRLADDGIIRRLDDGRQQAIREPHHQTPIGCDIVHGVHTLRGDGIPGLVKERRPPPPPRLLALIIFYGAAVKRVIAHVLKLGGRLAFSNLARERVNCQPEIVNDVIGKHQPCRVCGGSLV